MTGLTFRSPAIRRAHVEAVRAAAGEHQRRLSWGRRRIEAWRTQALRALLRHAVERSSFYRERLGGFEVDRVTPEGLRALPTTSKREVMERWDEVVTVPDIRRAGVERFLAQQTSFDYLADRYQAFESGGSSGIRGVYVWDWEVLRYRGEPRFPLRGSRRTV